LNPPRSNSLATEALKKLGRNLRDAANLELAELQPHCLGPGDANRMAVANASAKVKVPNIGDCYTDSRLFIAPLLVTARTCAGISD